MTDAYKRLLKCYEYCKTRVDVVPKTAIILGSGLGDFADHVKVTGEIPYSDIEDFPVSTVAGHAGKFVFAEVEGVTVVMMQGRVHYYEGYSMEDVVLPVRLMKMMGAETVILTNASGGINEKFSAGDFMMITDQISSFVPSPLIGENIEELGTRFPDMSEIYDKELQSIIRQAAKEADVHLQEGVYIQFTGPNFESPAEIRMARTLGADAVGMSTTCEAIAARHMGMRVCGISCVVNMAAGIQKTPLNHEEVQEMGRKKAEEFRRLLRTVLSLMGRECQKKVVQI